MLIDELLRCYLTRSCGLGVSYFLTTRSDLDIVLRIAVEQGTRSRSEASLTSLQGGAVLPPPGSRKKTWEEEFLSLSICLSHTAESSTVSRIKCEWYILIKKCVRSFIEVRKFCIIMFPLIFVLRLKANMQHMISTTFKSHTEWGSTHHVSAPTTTKLPTIAAIYHSLNCFSHVIYAQKFSTCQYIAKLLAHSYTRLFSLIFTGYFSNYLNTDFQFEVIKK